MTRMKFKTKIDWWLHLIFTFCIIINIWLIATAINSELGTVIVAVMSTFLNIFLIIPMWFNTYYLLDENELHVKSGLFDAVKIDLGLITNVSETRNPQSSPALSLDRLEIKYKVKNSRASETIIISPKDKQEFIRQLKTRNDNIEISDGVQPISKKYKILFAIIGLTTVIGGGALVYFGEREPVVIIHDHNIQIRSMYGTSVNFSDIADIFLIDQSMGEIGAGTRTNGYSGWAWKGHFTAGLLFVQPNAAPTIRIERVESKDIYINFRNRARTEFLFRELTTVVIVSHSSN